MLTRITLRKGNALQAALDSLRHEVERLRGQYDTARSTVTNLEDEIKRVQKAIAILLGEKLSRPRAKKTGAVGLTGEDVVVFIERVLTQHGALKEPELRTKVWELAKAEGRSRKGLHFPFKKAIKDQRFTWTGARWRLK